MKATWIPSSDDSICACDEGKGEGGESFHFDQELEETFPSTIDSLPAHAYIRTGVSILCPSKGRSVVPEITSSTRSDHPEIYQMRGRETSYLYTANFCRIHNQI